MVTWLVNNLTTVLLIVTVLALVWVFVVYLIRQNARGLKPRTPFLLGSIGLGLLAALALTVILLGVFVQTDQRMIEGAVREMAAGIEARDTRRVFAHVSDEFNQNGMNKNQARQFLDNVIRRGDVTDVEVWDFEPVQVSDPGGGRATATVIFKVKVRGNWGSGAEFYKCHAAFVREADAKWRLRGFEVRHPVDNQPIRIPGGPG